MDSETTVDLWPLQCQKVKEYAMFNLIFIIKMSQFVQEHP